MACMDVSGSSSCPPPAPPALPLGTLEWGHGVVTSWEQWCPHHPTSVPNLRMLFSLFHHDPTLPTLSPLFHHCPQFCTSVSLFSLESSCPTGVPILPRVSPRPTGAPTAEQGHSAGEQGVLHPRGVFGVTPSSDTLHPQNSMNLPPDKMKLLNQYDNEKKWELICDQERFQVKNPPSAYIQKLKSYLDTGGVSRKFKRRVQESTQVLRELEISLRTNYIGWVQEFLNEENKGLDVLLEYLAFAQCSVAYDMESTENSPGSDKGKERSLEDLNKSTSSSPTQGSSKPRPLTVR
ncbi:formin-like protein 1 [Cyanistes caeruleus]|uniref:formin-like protein 1 n=1 Tax=Cyanistes caeruleus TaxID=156563 RepID=UPI000CDB6110|nr:formin-like protein 1 [Cyanistes caeruleus]